MVENNDKKPNRDDSKYYLFALKIAGDFGVTIAVPVVILAIIGQKIDSHYGTRPLFLILGMALAATITAWMIYKKTKNYSQEFQDLDKKK